VGPQHTFVLPNGILRPHGHNSLAIAVTSNAPGAGGLGTVKLVNLGTAKSSLTVNDVDSPAYARPTLHPAVLDGTSIDGPVATVDIPPDARGTSFQATIDWGDGTTSEGTVTSTTVNGTHTYAQPGRHHVTVTLSDRYGAAVLDSATADTTTVGATVPAQLSLTLGPAASFGAFVPGTDKTYSAQTTANVISTAGDAALSVSDPGHLTNGAFSLPEALQVTFSKAAWTGPVSNDLVNIGFSQHIGASDALRTGSYSRTLTFTLSTTTP
jgi:PKD domain